VLVLPDAPLFPGWLVDCQLIGVIELEQEEEDGMKQNDRLIGVASASILYSGMKDLSQLNPAIVKQIEAFFVNYQALRDVKVRIPGRSGPDKAREILRRNKRRK
jgi:inorganic pyrophosphatase